MTHPALDLTGKVALITGGNGGIGYGMAEGLALAGAAVVIWGTNEEKNKAAAEKLGAHGARVLADKVSVADENAVEQGFARAVSHFGRVDAVFANAGVGGHAPSFMEMTTAEWRRVMAVNLDGAFFTLREAARHMSKRPGGGSLVGMASLAAVSGQARGQHYAATKGGLISMIKACAVELARYGVRANSILPGWIETSMTDRYLDVEPFRGKVLPRVPARRWGKPDDFAGIAVYLTSDLSQYHSGDTFMIDGGYGVF